MAIVTWKGWRDHPTEKLEEAYEILIATNFKPFYNLFCMSKAKNNESKGNIEKTTSRDYLKKYHNFL